MLSSGFANVGDAKSTDSSYVLGKSWISEFAGLDEPSFRRRWRREWSEWRVGQWIEQIGQRMKPTSQRIKRIDQRIEFDDRMNAVVQLAPRYPEASSAVHGPQSAAKNRVSGFSGWKG